MQAWAKNPRHVEMLKDTRGIVSDTPLWPLMQALAHINFLRQLFGGAPLDKAAGDYLFSRGVNLFTVYGWYV